MFAQFNSFIFFFKIFVIFPSIELFRTLKNLFLILINFCFNLNTSFFFISIYNFKIFFFNYYFNKNFNAKLNLINELNFNSNYFTNLDLKYTNLVKNEENLNSSRHVKFNNPVFKYDYKSGDYFPKLYKEVYSHLYSSILNLTGGLRTSPWFFSNNLNDVIINNFNEFLSSLNKKTSFGYSSVTNKFNNADAFNNFFFLMNGDLFSNKLISSTNLNLKFQKMFLSSSLQQRIYSN